MRSGINPVFKVRLLVFLPVLFLNIMGILAIASTKESGFASPNVKKQIIFITLAIVEMLIILKIDFKFLKTMSYLLYLLGLLSLIMVILIGSEINGAKSWIRLPGGLFNLQPSEFVKITLILILGRVLENRKTYSRWRDMLLPFVLTVMPMLFILKQPDLGSSMVFLPTLFLLLFAVGAKVKNIIFVIVLGLILMGGLWKFTNFIKSYQKARVYAWIYPDEYKKKESFQLLASLMAIGDGGLTGKGYRQGSIHRFKKLPESHTDFIYAVIAEDFGFVGAVSVVLGYLFLLYGLLSLLSGIREPYSLCIILGVTSLLFVQVVISFSVVLGLMPTTGVTLPFVSYGGSSILANYLAISLAMGASHSSEWQVSQKEFDSE